MCKKYCIFAAQFLPHMGGIENYTYNISKELIKRGNQVTVITNNTTNSSLQETIEGIRVLRFPCFNFIDGRFPVPKLNRDFWKIHRYLKKKEYDLVAINARFYLHSLYAACYARKKKIKSICIEHGTSHLSVHNKVLDLMGGVYEHIHTALLKMQCKDYYGVSKACNEWLQHFGIQARGVLYNSIDLEKVKTVQNSTNISYREEYRIPKTAIVVTFTGRLIREKGLPEFLNVAEQISREREDVYFFIAGDGVMEKEVNMRKNRYIIPVGRIDFEHVISLLMESDIFCLPSFSEGFSTSILEAAACGCYVITTARGGAKELLLNEEYGCVMPDNKEETLYHAYCRILDNRKKRDRGISLTGQRLKECFTWNIVTDQIESICKETEDE